MPRSLSRLLILALFLLPCFGAAAPASAKEAPRGRAAGKPASSLAELQARLAQLTRDLTRLREAALRDPDEMRISIYEGYSLQALSNRKRAVRAEHLVAFMVDPTKTLSVRTRAKVALEGGPLRGDPDVSATEKHGRQSERGYFGTKRLLVYLRADDRVSRTLTHELLSRWWRVRGVPAILAYRADKPKTWKPAIDAWKRELRKRK